MSIDIVINQKLSDQARRERVFAGDILVFLNLESCSALCEYALATLCEFFDTDSPQTIHHHLPVDEFVRRSTEIKKRFTNSLKSKEILRVYAQESGLNPNQYYFDLPRLRIVPHYEYLHAGVSYAYAPHRDTWYGGPTYQINHWMPVLAIEPAQAMAIYPGYFTRPIKNSSADFNLEHWVNVERERAPQNIGREMRSHPLPLEEIDAHDPLRLAGDAGTMMVFSGTHLHATVPNLTQTARFSVDFRFFHVDDIRSSGLVRVPDNIDAAAKSKDFGVSYLFHLGDFSPYPNKEQAG